MLDPHLLITTKAIENLNMVIGHLIFDLQRRTLSHEQDTVKLRNKEFFILQMLLKSPGAVVSNQEIINKLWQGDDKLGTKGVRQVIWKLRQYFGDSFNRQQYIETIPNIGYRFVFPVGVERKHHNLNKIIGWFKAAKSKFSHHSCTISKVPISSNDSSSSRASVSTGTDWLKL